MERKPELEAEGLADAGRRLGVCTECGGEPPMGVKLVTTSTVVRHRSGGRKRKKKRRFGDTTIAHLRDFGLEVNSRNMISRK